MLQTIRMFNSAPQLDKFHKLSLRQTVLMVGNKMSYQFRDDNELSPYLTAYQQAFSTKIYGNSMLDPFYQPDIDKDHKILKRIQNDVMM